jgi:arylsulfatase
MLMLKSTSFCILSLCGAPMIVDKSSMTSSSSHDHRVQQLLRSDSRPNILIMMTDQQRSDTICAGGASFMKTPNIDRLASYGRLYTNAYSPNPICMPARHNMLTGLTARHHGYPENCYGFGMPLGIPTFPQILSDHGYETRTIGKNHFYPSRRHNGYLNMELMEEVPAFREEDQYLMYLKKNGYGHVLNIHGVRNLLYMVPQRSQIPEEHHGTTWVANSAIDFIETNHGRHPWLLTLGWIAPHPPFNVPDEFSELYNDVEFPGPHVSKTSISSHAEENKLLGDLPNQHYLRRMRELYYGAITHVDHHVGRILDSLESSGQLQNTLILFISDHGEMLGDHGTYQKWLPYDSCSKIPFILHFPDRVNLGEVSDDFVDLNDVLPTILDAAGLEYPGSYELAGRSLLEDVPRKSHQYIEYASGNRRWISFRNNTHKYNYYFGGGKEELFNLEQDHTESENLLEVSQNEVRHIKEDLHDRLVQHEKIWGLQDTVQGDEFVAMDPLIAKPYRNRAFPIFQNKITNNKEISELNDFFDEVLTVIKKEPIVNLGELDLITWKKSGNFTDKEISDLIERR